MKKAIIALLVLILMFFGGMTIFARLVEGSHLIANEGIEREGRPILEGKYLDIGVVVIGEEVYMPYSGVKKYFHPDLEVDLEKKKMYLTPSHSTFAFENKEIDSFVKKEAVQLNFNLKEIAEQLYVPIKTFENWLGIKVNVSEVTGIVTIDWVNSAAVQGEIIEKAYLLAEPKTLAKRMTTLSIGANVRVYDQKDGYMFIRTEEGYLGFIQEKRIRINQSELGESPGEIAFFREKVKTQQPPEEKIGLVWDYVNQYTKDRSNEAKLGAIDVLSPTWFKMIHGDGTIENKGDVNYVKDAKDKGYQVWGLVTNSFDPDMTSSFLANEEAQGHFIRQILLYSGLYDLDGINIDFENIHYRDQMLFTAFVQRLTEELHRINLVVSIDVTIPSTSPNWSMVYDRKALGDIVDYVAVMTYDEHWAASPKSGSVASIGWVERGIQKTLESIPAEKVLLGLPFYTRLWEEEPLSNGRVKVSSKAYGMEKIKEILQENNAEIIWDDKTGQYYSEYQVDGKTYRVWIEDSRSLALKSSLVEKYNLAGIAAWRKDFEVDEVWITLDELIKQGKTYEEVVFRLNN